MTTILIQFIKVRVATLTLNSPDRRDALKSCANNPDVGTIVITGSHKAFCEVGVIKRIAGCGAIDKRKRLCFSGMARSDASAELVAFLLSARIIHFRQLPACRWRLYRTTERRISCCEICE